MRTAHAVAVLVLCAGMSHGQASNPGSVGSTVKQAPTTTAQLTQGTDTITPAGLDRAIHDLYDSISGPAGQKRDPDRFRNLFVKQWGRLTSIGKDRETGNLAVNVLSPDDYIAKSFPYLEKNGFFESEVARRTERFGDIIQVWSTYESRHKPGEAPFARGINGIQYVNIDNQWKVLSIFWEAERPDNPIPQQYLAR
jgi:hypothetical protein